MGVKIYNEREGAAMTKRTLEERAVSRYKNSRYKNSNRLPGVSAIDHIRAELDRLARKVRKLDHRSEVIWRKEVLALIKEAKQ